MTEPLKIALAEDIDTVPGPDLTILETPSGIETE
jgi:hypothetical protein